MLEKTDLSGVQLIVKSLDPDSFKDNAANPKNFRVTFDGGEHRRCALCGGHLTEQHYEGALASFSSSWRSSNELEAKDEDCLCSACKWFLSGRSNRQSFLPVGRFVVFDGEEVRSFTSEEFYSFLKEGFAFPCVITYLGKSSRTQKNVAWKLNRTISTDSEDAKVSLLALNTADSLVDGTACISASTFLPMVDRLMELSKQHQEIMSMRTSNLSGQYFATLRRMRKEFSSLDYQSEELLLAIYIACNIVFPEMELSAKEKGAKPRE